MYYVKVKRTISVGREPGIKFVARLFRGKDVEIEQVAQEISEATTVGEPDVLACLKALESVISRHVQNGSAVKLGLLGSFIPSLKAQAQKNREKVTADTIKRIACRFYPTPNFKKTLKSTRLEEKDLKVKGYESGE
ncbi:MAG: HU family DNA-binding protein [Bacteroidales bacterium]|nr:HU family DNA-binding protein [Bacteroidales bacterium]